MIENVKPFSTLSKMSALNRLRKSVSIWSGTIREPPTDTTTRSLVCSMIQTKRDGYSHHTLSCVRRNVDNVFLVIYVVVTNGEKRNLVFGNILKHDSRFVVDRKTISLR